MNDNEKFLVVIFMIFVVCLMLLLLSFGLVLGESLL